MFMKSSKKAESDTENTVDSSINLAFECFKTTLGWNVAKRRDDRIDNALFCTSVWHNMFNMGRS
jgi:transposase